MNVMLGISSGLLLSLRSMLGDGGVEISDTVHQLGLRDDLFVVVVLTHLESPHEQIHWYYRRGMELDCAERTGCGIFSILWPNM